MLRHAGLLLLLLLSALLWPCTAEAQPDQPKGKARVGAAISLKEPLTEAGADFEKETGIKIELTLGSSGQIAGQIKAGAPIDLFISAGQPQIDQLIDAKLLDPRTVRPVAGNRLVVVTPAESTLRISRLEDLTSDQVGRVAVGEPKTVPAGQYAAQALTKAQVADQLTQKTIYGANVRQVLDYVERAEVGAGIVYASDAQASGGKTRVALVIDESFHDPVRYPAGPVAGAANAAHARRFMDYLRSERGQVTFRKHGLTSPDAPPAATQPARPE